MGFSSIVAYKAGLYDVVCIRRVVSVDCAMSGPVVFSRRAMSAAVVVHSLQKFVLLVRTSGLALLQ